MGSRRTQIIFCDVCMEVEAFFMKYEQVEKVASVMNPAGGNIPQVFFGGTL